MNLHFDNDWSKTLKSESNYFYSAFGSSKCEKTCLDKGVEKKDENIPMSLWNQCIGNCERERDEKQKETWGKITDYAKDMRWGDIFGNIFGKKEPAGNGGTPPPPEKEGILTMTWLIFIIAIIFFLFLLSLVFRKKEDEK